MTTSMLDRAIEIEGLLRIIRDGNPLPETFTLLRRKASELAEDATLLEENSKIKADRESTREDTIWADEIARKDFSENEGGVAMAEEESIEVEIEEEAEEALRDNGSSVDEDTDSVTEISMEDENSQSDSDEMDDDILLALEEEDIADDKNAEKAAVCQAPKHPSAKSASKLKSKFSLNDRFLYSRELFGGDMKMFDSTLSFIEGIESFPIIEDYFYSELEWNPENRYVALFMETLRPNFKE